MKKWSEGELLTLSIHGMGCHGEGVGNFEGYIVFVEGALPGEVVNVRLVECHQKYGRGELISFVSPSAKRVKPPCKLFGRCGGCQLMHLSYPEQLTIKRQRIIDAFTRIGKSSDFCVEPCHPSPLPLGYRNKIQLPAAALTAEGGSGGIELGLYARNSHEVVAVEECFIHASLGEEVYRHVRAIIKESPLVAYDPLTGRGELRSLLIKSAVNAQEVLVVLATKQKASLALRRVAAAIKKRCPTVKGVVHHHHTGRDNSALGGSYHLLEGEGFIQERLGELTFKVSPASFFQVNPQQAELLYGKAIEFADCQEEESVLDAYCGVGTLSLFFAKRAKSVIGVECIEEAIEDAKVNAALNGIDNVSFVCAAAEKFIASLKTIDIVLLNPPRKGCAVSLLQEIGRLKPSKLIYISCDPATLARDALLLRSEGYHVKTIQPYDMFPQTAHVECVVKFTL